MSHKWICWFIMSIFIVLPTNHWLSNGWTLEHQNMAKKYILYHYCPVKAGKSVFEIVET